MYEQLTTNRQKLYQEILQGHHFIRLLHYNNFHLFIYMAIIPLFISFLS